jgi:hypothetical protein
LKKKSDAQVFWDVIVHPKIDLRAFLRGRSGLALTTAVESSQSIVLK